MESPYIGRTGKYLQASKDEESLARPALHCQCNWGVEKRTLLALSCIDHVLNGSTVQEGVLASLHTGLLCRLG